MVWKLTIVLFFLSKVDVVKKILFSSFENKVIFLDFYCEILSKSLKLIYK